MTKLIKFLIIFLFVLVAFGGPIFVGTAHAEPLVFCGRLGDPGAPGTQPCTFCDTLVLIKNIINFVFFTIVPAISTILFMVAGFMIIFGNTAEGISKGRSIFTTTVVGIVIIMTSWLITNFILKSIAGSNDVSSSWYKLECKGPISQPQTKEKPKLNLLEICENKELLAETYKSSKTIKNAPATDRALQYIKNNLPGEDLGEISTFDKTYSDCNYTKGNPVCNISCSHTINSCHYGGASGDEGALAIDFGNEKIGDKIIQVANASGEVKSARCETSNGETVSCSSSSATHVHISIKGCDKN